MRRTANFFAILLLGGLSASADSYQPELWKLSSADNVVYLLGSTHLGLPEMYPLPKTIEAAFTASPVLLVETYSSASDPAGQALNEELLREKGLYPDNDSLWKHISKPARRRLTDFCKKNQVLKKNDLRAKDLARFQPWVLAIIIDLAPAMTAGMDADLGVDRHFIDEAERAGNVKRIVQVESAEFQTRLLSGFSQEMQVKLLEAKLGINVNGVEGIEKALVQDRNVHMAEVAEQFLKGTEQAFMVVGKAHVDGDQGIVHLMERRGYKVERVEASK